jgi:hypothetical protein
MFNGVARGRAESLFELAKALDNISAENAPIN